MKKNNIQSKMFEDIHDQSLFERSLQYGQEYIEKVFSRNTFPDESALRALCVLDEVMPENGTGAHEIITTLNKVGSPATVAQLGGRYFGFVNGSAVPAGLAAKQLATFWDQNAGLNIISPITGALESVVEKWLNELFGLPDNCVSGFVTGTSSANFCGLAAARFHLLLRQGWNVNLSGLWNAPKIRVIAGEQAHSSILKAVNMIGFGRDNIEWVATNDQGRITVDALPELDETCLVLLQAGNVNSGSFDDFENICNKANKAKAWVHVDGAFGLWAACANQLKSLTAGLEKADSWAVDGHKTLNTPYDCGIVLCKHKEALANAMHMSGSYLVLNENRDGMFYTPDMSRRSRAIELWATLKFLGKIGLDEMITNFHLHAKRFAHLLSETEGFEVLNDIVFNQVVVCCKDDQTTTNVLAAIQRESVCWAGPSYWKNKKVIRISVCSWATTESDIILSYESFCRALSQNQ